jgi:hypothetical protein
MRARKPDIELVKRAVRSNLCPHCPLRWGPPRNSLDAPSECELRCDLFRHLPGIRRIAACNDPMIRSNEQMIAAAVQSRAPEHGKFKSQLWRNRRRLVALLTRLFGG